MYKIIQKRRIWLTLSSVVVGLAIIAIIVWGLNLGIDFTGGSLLEVKFLQVRPTVSEVQEKLADLELGSLTIQPVGEDGMILRFQDTSEEKHQKVLGRLANVNQTELSGEENTKTQKHKNTKTNDGISAEDKERDDGEDQKSTIYNLQSKSCVLILLDLQSDKS